MAYLGLCNLVMAPLDGDEYGDGFRLTKAVTLEVNPEYEDVSDYNDINDTDPEDEFQYAELTLKMTDEPAQILGMDEGELIEYEDIETRQFYGLGYIRRLTSSRYEAGWLTKIKLREASTSQETKGEAVEYGLPEYTGKAFPDNTGIWKKKRVFTTKENAMQFIYELANMEVNNG